MTSRGIALGSLYARIALVFALILLCTGASLSWFGYRAARQHQHEVLQRVSLGLAAHIAGQLKPDDVTAAGSPRMKSLFNDLIAVNPNMEVYLLDPDGDVLQASTGGGVLQRHHVGLVPLRALENAARLPITADNPRHAEGREIFSVAPIRGSHGVAGYIYIVLLNDMYRQMVDAAWKQYALRSTVEISAIALLAALMIGLAAFALVTRRLQRVTREVEAVASETADHEAPTRKRSRGGDEIDRLASAFATMRERLKAQMNEIRRQDELRRELIANVSHDLRTPLTSMQGYLETLARIGDELSREEQKQYLEVAVRQSHRVSHMANQLFELARLEYEETQLQTERFSISELVQDVAQKYAIIAQRKDLKLRTHADGETLFVHGDIGMIERVISNLLDNAIRHTPEHGEIQIEARRDARGIEICVCDNGQGISAEHLPGLLERDSPLRKIAAQRGGGLGLLIAKRILSLHGSHIHAVSGVGQGTRISFVLPVAGAGG